jgi:lysophospholipid acyltransferase (LPLAT)-like uncharacterized protein
MKRFLLRTILPYLGLLFVKIIYSTYKIRIINDHIEKNIFNKGNRPIYASWHQRFFPGILFLSQRKPIAIIVSLSKDGDIISNIIKILGWHPIRGSSSRGGANALQQIKELAGSGYSLGHIVDGPKGPFGEVKPGIIALAKASGMPILPTIISAENKWIFGSWDKFIIPKPFSKIIIKFEKEIYIPGNSGKEDFELHRAMLKKKLFDSYESADKYWQ